MGTTTRTSGMYVQQSAAIFPEMNHIKPWLLYSLPYSDGLLHGGAADPHLVCDQCGCPHYPLFHRGLRHQHGLPQGEDGVSPALLCLQCSFLYVGKWGLGEMGWGPWEMEMGAWGRWRWGPGGDGDGGLGEMEMGAWGRWGLLKEMGTITLIAFDIPKVLRTYLERLEVLVLVLVLFVLISTHK